jgi:cobalt-zinc-cadmium efflux system outer membrane protein
MAARAANVFTGFGVIRMKASIVPMLAAALFAPVVLAQPRAPALGLPQAVELAQQHNSTLRVLAQEVAALDARTVQARATPNPTLDYLREGQQEQGGASSVQLAIPLELGGKRGARMAVAEAELAVAAAELAAGRMRVQAEALAAFHDVYLAEQRLALAEQASASARRSTSNTAARVGAGKISPVEETRSRLAEASVQLEAIQAGRELADARIKLAFLIGSDAASLPRLAAPALALPVAPSAAHIAERVAAAPLAQRANAELAWRGAAARLERSKRYPDLTLVVGKKREGVGRDHQTVFGLSVPLPVFDRNQGALLEAERRVDKSRAEQEANRQKLQADAALAANKLSAALEQERLLRDTVLPGGQSAYAAAGKGFEAGKFSFLELLDAQRSYFQAQVLHLRAVAEAHRAAAELAALIGPLQGALSPLDTQEAP